MPFFLRVMCFVVGAGIMMLGLDALVHWPLVAAHAGVVGIVAAGAGILAFGSGLAIRQQPYSDGSEIISIFIGAAAFVVGVLIAAASLGQAASAVAVLSVLIGMGLTMVIGALLFADGLTHRLQPVPAS